MIFFTGVGLLLPSLSYSQNEGAGTVDRKVLFEVINQMIPTLVYQFVPSSVERDKLLTVLAEQLGSQGYYASDSRSPYPDWQHLYTGAEIIFAESHGRFQLNEGEPPRTAVVDGQEGPRRNPIWINKKIIQDPKIEIDVLDVVQLLMHEHFHFIGPKNQMAVDALIAQAIRAMQPYYRKISLGLNQQLHFLSFPYRRPQQESGFGSRSYGANLMHWQALSESGFVGFHESALSFRDITAEVSESLLASWKLRGFRSGMQNYLQVGRYLEASDFELREQGANGKWSLNMTIRRTERFERRNQSYDYWQMEELGKSSSEVFQYTLGLERSQEGLLFNRFRLQKTYQAGDLSITPSFKQLQQVEGLKRISIQVPDELVTSQPKLLVESADFSFELEPAHRQENVFDYEMSLRPEGLTQEVRANSIVAHENQRFYLDREVKLAEPDAKNNETLQLRGLRVLTPAGWEKLADEKTPYVEPGSGVFRVFVQSTTPIKFVRLRKGIVTNSFVDSQLSRNGLRQENPYSYPDSMSSPAVFQTQYEELLLNSDQFKQYQKGGFTILEIPVQHIIQASTVEQGADIKQRISRFFKQSYREKKIKGWDTGWRSISQLEVVNEAFQSAQLHPAGSYRVETTPLRKREIEPSEDSGSGGAGGVGKSSIVVLCQKAYRPQYLPLGKHRRGQEFQQYKIEQRIKARMKMYE